MFAYMHNYTTTPMHHDVCTQYVLVTTYVTDYLHQRYTISATIGQLGVNYANIPLTSQ